MKNLTSKGNRELFNPDEEKRRPEITIDQKQIKRHDYYHRYVSRRTFVTLMTTLLLILFAIILYYIGYWEWTIFLSFLSAGGIFTYFILAKLKLGITYQIGTLVPAVVINNTPLEIAVITEIVAEKKLPKQYGCKRMRIKSLPLHTLQIGERVPCVAICHQAENGYYTSFESRPLSWATCCKEEIEQEIARIDATEWERLEMLLKEGKLHKFRYDEIAYYDEAGSLMGIIPKDYM